MAPGLHLSLDPYPLQYDLEGISSYQDVEPVSPPPESGPILRFELACRMLWKNDVPVTNLSL